MSINYCGYLFTNLTQLSNWQPPQTAGVYVILKPNEQYPKSFLDLIYVGQSDNMAQRGFDPNSDDRKCWLKEVKNEAELRIATYLMPNSTEIERKAIESQIIEAEKPPCNKQS